MAEPGHTEEQKRGLAKRTHEFLVDLSKKDSLTGLKNKSALQDEWESAHSLLKRGELRYKLIFLDLDKFKAVNDIDKSHKLGDEVLKKVAETLTEMIRPEDTMARVGGDEFAGLLVGDSSENNEVTQSKFESRFKEKFQELIGEDMLSKYPQIKDLGVSMGIADPEINDTFDTLYERGDKLMYQRKESKGIAR